jgi:hypothetical protein
VCLLHEILAYLVALHIYYSCIYIYRSV